jgi:cephalosporin hydroxylase
MNRLTKILLAVLAALVFGLGLLSIRLWHSRPPTVPAAMSDAEVVGRTRQMAQNAREWRNGFLGIPIMQYPNDLMTYQQLLFDVKPDIVIETGTAFGGFTLYLAMLLENVNEKARVLSVDLDNESGKLVLTSASVRQSLKDRIRFFHGSSTDPKIFEQMAALAKGKKVFVVLDSLHQRAHVLKELELYSPLVQHGGYVIVNDTHLEGTEWLPDGDPGPAGAVRDFLLAHPEFKRATLRREFLISCFPAGVLVRAR